MDPKVSVAVYQPKLISGNFFQTRKGMSNQYKRNVLVHWKVEPKIPDGTVVVLKGTVDGANYEEHRKTVKTPNMANFTIVKGVLKQVSPLVAGRDDVEIRNTVVLATTIEIGADPYPSDPPTSEEDPIETDPC